MPRTPLLIALVLGLAAIGVTEQAASEAASDHVRVAWNGSEGPFVHARYVVDGAVASEEWLDVRSGTTRTIDNDKEVTVQDGAAIVQWNTAFPRDANVIIVYDPKDPWLESTSFLLEVKRALQSGRAYIVGSTATTHTVRFRIRSKEAPGDLVAEVEVERPTLLPIEYRLTTGGKTVTQHVDSERLTELPLGTLQVDPQVGVRSHASAVPLTAAQFAARGAWSVRHRRLRSGDLAAAAKFGVYTLGRTYVAPGIRLRFGAAAIEERREEPREQLKFRWKPQLYLGYVRGKDIYAEPVIELDEQAAGTRQAVLEYAAYPRRYARLVTIEGKTRRVHLLGRKGRRFAMIVDGTLIQGGTRVTIAETLRALSSLRRVRGR